MTTTTISTLMTTSTFIYGDKERISFILASCDGHTDIHTDGRTGKAANRDARTHPKNTNFRILSLDSKALIDCVQRYHVSKKKILAMYPALNQNFPISTIDCARNGCCYHATTILSKQNLVCNVCIMPFYLGCVHTVPPMWVRKGLPHHPKKDQNASLNYKFSFLLI